MSAMETTDAPQVIEHQHQGLTFTPYETKWVPCSARFVCAGITPKAKGILQVYELKSGKMEVVEEKTHASGFKCGTFGASSLSERSIAMGDYAGGLNIFDLERLDAPTWSVPKAHSAIINGIDGIGGLGIGGGAPELCTGSRDGCVA